MMMVVVLAAGLVGCSSATTVDPSVPPYNAVVVVGASVCEMTPVSDNIMAGVIVERFICQDDMSDPRVSGAEELLVETRVDDNYAVAGTWTTQQAQLTNDQGTWRGTTQGVVDLTGVLPFAEGVVPYNYGEGHYVGEGAFDGLEYHYYVSGSNREAGLTGWITSSE